MAQLPVTSPHPTLATATFWDEAAKGRLVLPQCDNCGNVIWYPRRFCPVCHHHGVSWIEACGHGTVYSFTVVRKGHGAWRDVAPYVLAYVELDEGPRVMTNVIDVEPGDVRVGMDVEVAFDRDGDTVLPRFRPAG
jgi:uncharacterized OB-fold protein